MLKRRNATFEVEPRRRRRVIAASVALAVIASVALSSCGSSDNAPEKSENSSGSKLVADLQEKGKLSVGISTGGRQFQDDKGKWVGVVPDFLESWANDLGVEVEYHNTTFAAAVAGVQSNRWDIAPNLSVTPERKAAASFADPDFFDFPVLIADRKTAESGTNAFESVNTADATVCAVTGSPYLNDLNAGVIKLAMQVIELPDSASCLNAMQAGRASAVLYSWITGSPFVAEHDRFALVAIPDEVPITGVAIAVNSRYNEEDLAPLNEAIAKWMASPEGLAAANERWGIKSPLDKFVGDIPEYVSENLNEMRLAE